MRKLTVSVLIAVLAAPSAALARPSTLDLSCGQAAATVAKAGAIVLTTGPHTYDRFVAASTFCLGGEIAQPAIAPTADSPQCQIGYVCKSNRRSSDDD